MIKSFKVINTEAIIEIITVMKITIAPKPKPGPAQACTGDCIKHEIINNKKFIFFKTSKNLIFIVLQKIF